MKIIVTYEVSDYPEKRAVEANDNGDYSWLMEIAENWGRRVDVKIAS